MSCIESAYPDGGHSEDALRDNLVSPKTTSQLLQNLKRVQERRLMMQPTFYRESNLRELFGADEVRWQRLRH
jgi:hypothetical protein